MPDMKTVQEFAIREEKNVIDDHLLDIIGNEFKFSHEKGLAEWLKNSAEAYWRIGLPDTKQHVGLRFTDGAGRRPVTFECIDFVGMTQEDIDKAFKRWGDPEAAARGRSRKLYGGHGNGGKFYMRQMFKKSLFITYREGKLNVFGFSEKKKYGYAEGYKDVRLRPQDALAFAGIGEMEMPENIKGELLKNERGFTVVRGIDPAKVKRKIRMKGLIRKLRHHPQARQVLRHAFVSCIYNDEVMFERLEPESIAPMKEFEEPFYMEIPAKVTIKDEDERIEVELANKRFPAGTIVLHTSSETFGSGSLADLNRIEIIGEFGVIASYLMKELPYLRHQERADFIYGECRCPILEDPDDDCVKNDRTKLQEENSKTKALLQWICEQVDALAELMHEEESKRKKTEEDKLSSGYNKVLNDWKNKMMSKFLQDWVGGKGVGAGVGLGEGGHMGTGQLGVAVIGGGEEGGAGGKDEGGGGGDGGIGGGEGEGEGGTGKKGEDAEVERSGKKGSEDKTDEEGGGGEKKKTRRFRQVLLSSKEADPLSPTGGTLDLPPQQLAVYQRAIDIDHGIYWINTSRPLAEAIINRYSVESPEWRNYLFQRYVDIFVKEALYALEQREVDLNISQIDDEIARTIRKVHDHAAKDLENFLFDKNYVVVEVTNVSGN